MQAQREPAELTTALALTVIHEEDEVACLRKKLRDMERAVAQGQRMLEEQQSGREVPDEIADHALYHM